jgi:deoxyribonuclease V
VEPGTHPSQGAFVAADVHYLASGGARAAAVVAADVAFSRLAADRIALVPDAEPYQQGRFYLRELPALRAVLNGLDQMALLIIDGYADLDPDGRPGLGAHARDEFGVPVIGVAKSAFRTATHAIAVRRSTSVARCTSRPPGCPAPTPPASSGTWPASTGCPTPCAAPIASPATAYRSRRDAEGHPHSSAHRGRRERSTGVRCARVGIWMNSDVGCAGARSMLTTGRSGSASPDRFSTARDRNVFPAHGSATKAPRRR